MTISDSSDVTVKDWSWENESIKFVQSYDMLNKISVFLLDYTLVENNVNYSKWFK